MEKSFEVLSFSLLLRSRPRTFGWMRPTRRHSLHQSINDWGEQDDAVRGATRTTSRHIWRLFLITPELIWGARNPKAPCPPRAEAVSPKGPTASAAKVTCDRTERRVNPALVDFTKKP